MKKISRCVWTVLCATGMLWAASVGAQLESCVIPIVESNDQAPVIDGKMEGSEWKYALELTGLVSIEGQLAQRQSMVYYVSDGKSLFVGAYVPAVPEGTIPEVKTGPKYDGKNYMDFGGNDRVEIKFSPPGKDKVGDFYIVADAAGHRLFLNIKGEDRFIFPEW